MIPSRITWLLAAALLLPPTYAQTQRPLETVAVNPLQQPDAQRTKNELSELLNRYPPTLRHVLALDPALLTNQSYLATYPALTAFLNAHPEIARDPSYYVGAPPDRRFNDDPTSRLYEMWGDVLGAIAAFLAAAMGIGLISWLIRSLIDYRRWSRLAKVQTEVHTKLVDRFTANDELLAYIQSAPGARFLQSAPIMLDGAPRSVGAPLTRILWSIQGGVVLLAAGIGLHVVSMGMDEVTAQPFRGMGVLAIALGLGFVASALISFLISRRLGLIEPSAARHEMPVN